MASKKAALEDASEIVAASHPDMAARRIFEELLARERLGNTCLGEGVAIPHCRMPCERPAGALLRLAPPLDFEALDGRPVDLVFALVVPGGEQQRHLELLGALAGVLNSAANREALRRADDDAELRETLLRMVDGAEA